MPLTAGQIIALACEAAHSPGKTRQALAELNGILSDLCQERDFAEARGQFLFNFNPTLFVSPTVSAGSGGGGLSVGGGVLSTGGGVLSTGGGSAPSSALPSAVWPAVQWGSGPYAMPLDYLRLSGSSGSHGAQRSFIWWLNGVPYPVIPVDLAEFDMQVQDAGLQSYVWLAATDMAAPIDDRILLSTVANTTAGSADITLADTTRLIGGDVLGVAGQGIVPGTTLTSLVAGSGGGGLSVGGGVLSTGGGVLSTGGGGTAGGTATLSRPANATIMGASVFFGYAPVIFVYPPPNGALQAMIRYQKQMPALVDTTRYPWFHNDGYLIDKLIGRLCRLNDDARADTLLAGPNVEGSAENRLSNYLAMKDDDASHPKRVGLDRRSFGRAYSRLDITKRVGW